MSGWIYTASASISVNNEFGYTFDVLRTSREIFSKANLSTEIELFLLESV